MINEAIKYSYWRVENRDNPNHFIWYKIETTFNKDGLEIEYVSLFNKYGEPTCFPLRGFNDIRISKIKSIHKLLIEKFNDELNGGFISDE